MESNFKIIIPKPCNEDWNQMTPDETGRLCNSCVKSVVDFSGMKSAEIQDYFVKHQGQKICGRFKTEQLDSVIIQIPREVLFSQFQFHKMFMLALLVSMGTTLFSCQNSNGDKQKIDGVEVVDSIQENTTMGLRLPPEDSLKINYAPAVSNKQLFPDSIVYNGSHTTGFTVPEIVMDSVFKIAADNKADIMNDSIKTEKK